MKTKLLPLLDDFGLSNINQLQFDINDDAIKINIQKSSNDLPIEVIFEEVTAFYFIDGNNDMNRVSANNLNSIVYYETGFGEFASASEDVESDEPNISIPNFALDLVDSSLYIEAKKINIGGQVFDVSRPIH